MRILGFSARATVAMPAMSAPPPLRVRKRKELVQRPAFLEGGGEMQVLELEMEFAAGGPGGRLAGQARGALHRPRDAARRGADGLQRDHCANVKGLSAGQSG